MTGTARVTPAILDALALAPMDLEALLHEIGCTKRGLSIALAHLHPPRLRTRLEDARHAVPLVALGRCTRCTDRTNGMIQGDAR